MDYDADGDLDILSGSYTGELYLFERTGKADFAQGEMILDQTGAPLKVSYSVTPEAIDMDADGDMDLVIGTRTQAVYLARNVGTKTVPAWESKTSPLKTVSGETIKGSNAHHADWDGDGIRDLLVGSESGGAWWYRNVGKNDLPSYEDRRVLVASPDFKETARGVEPNQPGYRSKIHVTDWNGDGRADLLIGDVQWRWYLTKPLSAEEEKAKAALEPAYEKSLSRVRASNKRLRELRKNKQAIPAELTKEREEALAELSSFSKEMRKFRKNRRSETHGWVWLYLRLPTGVPEDKPGQDAVPGGGSVQR